jgi:superfamily II DNA or RNA helicase
VYRVQKPDQLRTMEYGSTTYSHHAFEKSVMRNKRLLDDYLDMIVAASMRFHFEKYQKGDKLLIYCASIQMCTLVVEHLKASFKGVDVRRYVEDDPYENLLEPDVRVSTLLSAGTGHDIPGLTTVILTTAISSSQSNIQGFGRLRKLPDKRMQFVYFVCNDVPKHMEYHERKKDLLKTMALEYDSLAYHHPLG